MKCACKEACNIVVWQAFKCAELPKLQKAIILIYLLLFEFSLLAKDIVDNNIPVIFTINIDRYT